MSEYKTVRKNITMGEEIANWYEERASRLGMSQTNLMITALAEYIKQEKVANLFDEYTKTRQAEGKTQKE